MTSMVPMRARYGKIERLTETILDRFGADAPHVDVKSILRAHHIEIKSGELGEISGLIARSGSKCVIGVNARQAPVRQRFTMAHEFGHYCLHSTIDSHTDLDFKINYRNDVSSQATDVEEIEANFFAACLLMPKKLLDERDAVDCLDDDVKVGDLARVFKVSQHAMSLRLAKVYARHRPF